MVLRPCGYAEPSVMHVEVVVQNAELANDAAAFVGKDRVVDLLDRQAEGLGQLRASRAKNGVFLWSGG